MASSSSSRSGLALELMGSSSSSGSGLGRTPGPPKSLAQQFVDHRLLSRFNLPLGEPLPTPLNMEKYMKDDPPRQINLCMRLAVEFYNSQPGNVGKPKLKLEHVVGVRSNMFILENIDPVCYFHLYFTRTTKDKKYHFFAELQGNRGPETVRMCTEIEKKTASAINCNHCFGAVLHPPEGFIGHRSPRFIGYRPARFFGK